MYNNNIRFPLVIFKVLCISLMASGCAFNNIKDDSSHSDRFEPFNSASFNFNEMADKYLLKPVATSYAKYVPDVSRLGVSNFFDNLLYLNVTVNSLLQGEFTQGSNDLLRFTFNSTLGIAGLIDVATAMGLEKHNEDTGQTLAQWGIPQGAYLYFPFLGPNTTRNSTNIATRILLNPITYLSGAFIFPATAFNIINIRANSLNKKEIIDELSIDPYIFTRELYLQQRNYLTHGSTSTEDFPVEDYDYDDMFNDDDSSDGTLIIE